MEKQFVDFKLALKLKELGFDEHCFATYWSDGKFSRNPSHDMADLPIEGQPYTWVNSKIHINNCTAPLWQQAEDFLLKKYNLYGIIIPTITMHWTFKTMTVVEDVVEVPPYKHVDGNDYSSAEEARQACLEKLIELCKKD